MSVGKADRGLHQGLRYESEQNPIHFILGIAGSQGLIGELSLS